MRLWPFGNRESRAGFTSQVSDEVISRATYGGDPDANGLSAAAACTRFYTSAMALATVSPASLQPTLHPVALAAIGRMLASTGNYVADLTVSDTGQTMLLPTGDFEVAGLSPDPAQWAYELRYRVPSRSEPMRRRRPAAGVAHIRINELDTAPHLADLRLPLPPIGQVRGAVGTLVSQRRQHQGYAHHPDTGRDAGGKGGGASE